MTILFFKTVKQVLDWWLILQDGSASDYRRPVQSTRLLIPCDDTTLQDQLQDQVSVHAHTFSSLASAMLIYLVDISFFSGGEFSSAKAPQCDTQTMCEVYLTCTTRHAYTHLYLMHSSDGCHVVAGVG